MENKELLFLANLLKRIDDRKEGYLLSVRWLCLREDLQEEYVAKARGLVDEWWSEELAAEEARESA